MSDDSRKAFEDHARIMGKIQELKKVQDELAEVEKSLTHFPEDKGLFDRKQELKDEVARLLNASKTGNQA